jgi:replicative DNA helicase
LSRTLPTEEDAELKIIGCCVSGGLDVAIEAVERIPSQAFTRNDCQEWFTIIEAIATQGKQLSPSYFYSHWRERHPQLGIPIHLQEAVDQSAGIATLDYYEKKVVNAWRKRKILYALDTLQKKAYDPDTSVEDALAATEAVLSEQEIHSVTAFDGKLSARALITDMEDRFKLQGRLSGLASGFTDLDALTDGFQPGEQAIIAARPSMGKTAIGLNVLETICLTNRQPSLFVSCEMSTKALMRRLLSSYSKLPMKDIRAGRLTEDGMVKASTFAAKLSGSPLHVLDAVGGVEINKLCAAIRRACRKHGIKFVIVDYLQKIRASGKHEKRTYEVGEVSGALKALAVQTNAAFLTLAQLNRESEKDKGRQPKLADLADSGQIERDADMVALLHRNRGENKGRDAKLIVAKQRDGEVGILDLYFNGEFCRFENAAKEEPHYHQEEYNQ